MSCYHLGIDCGTQGLSVVLTDGSVPSCPVVAVGEGSYDMLPSPDSTSSSEICEQNPDDWIEALRCAMDGIRTKLAVVASDASILDDVVSIGISGQMHGEVLISATGDVVGPARLWCDGRNAAEGAELTTLFGTKVPKRATVARFLWTARNAPQRAARTDRITTPAGYIAYRLTGQFDLGIGEASGMFPIDQSTLDYDVEMMAKFDTLIEQESAGAHGGGNTCNDDGQINIKSIRNLLPRVRLSGQDGGTVSADGAAILGVPSLSTKRTAVAPAEGDQVSALAGSLIASPGQVGCCFGTSVCANSVGDRAFAGVSSAVDHFCAADGKPINMIWLRNGTTFMNTVLDMFGTVLGGGNGGGEGDSARSSISSRAEVFQAVMPRVLQAAPDCGGLLALPFMDDEPGLDVTKGGSAGLYGLDTTNADAGNAVKASLLSVMFNLKLGSEVLSAQGYPRTELVLSGGITKTPELGQVLADVFDARVTLLSSAEEGTAWGAALLAAYRHHVAAAEGSESNSVDKGIISWSDFLSGIDRGDTTGTKSRANTQFLPDAGRVAAYQAVYERYKELVETEARIGDAVR